MQILKKVTLLMTVLSSLLFSEKILRICKSKSFDSFIEEVSLFINKPIDKGNFNFEDKTIRISKCVDITKDIVIPFLDELLVVKYKMILINRGVKYEIVSMSEGTVCPIIREENVSLVTKEFKIVKIDAHKLMDKLKPIFSKKAKISISKKNIVTITCYPKVLKLVEFLMKKKGYIQIYTLKKMK